MQPLDRRVSEANWSNVTRLGLGGKVIPQPGSFWPHILVTFRGAVWTSVSLALVKPD